MLSSFQLFLIQFVFITPIVIVVNFFKRKSFRFQLYSSMISIYLFALLSITLTPVYIDLRVIESLRSQGYGFGIPVNMTPFFSIKSYDLNSSIGKRNFFGNLVLLVPFGMIIGKQVKRYILLFSLFGIFISGVIESIQYLLTSLYVIQPRSTDIDDVILNSIGFSFGLYVVYWIKKTLKKDAKVQTNIRVNTRGH
ncbi:VanZ family protein [Paenibacillus montanisoli]|uniref:VanZ-like domain-containing protein n=1 Tax=Paenibacillus montanisoli TaxID=2081970 RepID=A0A328U1Q0_9BACL|nr:VanZ family protein [Paenibacillus montanisoli]RAP75693.1 hypothetical protein DL346_09555 [Paenibacillus montanisoli]